MKIKSLKFNRLTLLIVFLAVSMTPVYPQLPASLEKELLEFNTDVYEAMKLIQTNSEAEAVKAISTVKPQLSQKASSLSSKLNKIPDLSESQEEEWMQKMSEKQEIKNLMALLNDPEFLDKIENSRVLQQEFEELISLLDLEGGSEPEALALSGSQACAFKVGAGSPLSGSYVVNSMEEEAFAYMDTENDQFVIEIHGENYVDVMLIIEKPVTGKHPFSMEMQVAIDLSLDDGQDYFGFDNRYEESGGYIQIDRLDEPGGIVSGSFHGVFNDSSTDEDKPVKVNGRFSVTRI